MKDHMAHNEIARNNTSEFRNGQKRECHMCDQHFNETHTETHVPSAYSIGMCLVFQLTGYDSELGHNAS